MYIVVFSPEDLRIVKDGPESRRKFIDRELCQIRPIYYSDLGKYKKVLKQRNFLLKSIGPHKDDLCIKINGKDIRSFGSQGQQRTASLSLKLAEIGLIKQETGKNSVLLLDDVLSELDQSRQKYLIDTMKDVQIFITATEIDENLKSILPEGKSIFIDNAKAYLYNPEFDSK